MTDEIWKDILGYEGLYQVSSFGRVRSFKPSGVKLLTGEALHFGHIRVSLSKNGTVKRFMLHRIVATHFIENINSYPVINHIDFNPKNNHFKNLEWCTQYQNIHHSKSSGRFNNQNGRPRTIDDCKILTLATFYTLMKKSIASKHCGLSHTFVGNILLNKTNKEFKDLFLFIKNTKEKLK